MLGLAAPVTAAPSDQGSDSLPRPSIVCAQSRPPAWPWAVLAAVLAIVGGSALALVCGGGTRDSKQLLQADLAGITQAWGGPEGLPQRYGGPSRAARASIVGDEGFWLSRNDLAGSTAGPVALGDRITITSKATVTVGSTPAEPHVFEVIELKSMAELGGGVAPAGHGVLDSATPRTVFTMVVCREVLGNAPATPRMIRFLIDSTAPSLSGPVQPPRTL